MAPLPSPAVRLLQAILRMASLFLLSSVVATVIGIPSFIGNSAGVLRAAGVPSVVGAAI
jgi:hypothetical protein